MFKWLFLIAAGLYERLHPQARFPSMCNHKMAAKTAHVVVASALAPAKVMGCFQMLQAVIQVGVWIVREASSAVPAQVVGRVGIRDAAMEGVLECESSTSPRLVLTNDFALPFFVDSIIYFFRKAALWLECHHISVGTTLTRSYLDRRPAG